MSALLLGQWNAHFPLTTNTLTSGLGPFLHTYISGHELLRVINGSHSGLSLGDECIIIGVVGDQQHVWGKKM